MKADIRKGIGCVYIVIKAETPEDRVLLDDVAEKRDWHVASKTSIPIRGKLHLDEVQLKPKEGA